MTHNLQQSNLQPRFKTPQMQVQDLQRAPFFPRWISKSAITSSGGPKRQKQAKGDSQWRQPMATRLPLPGRAAGFTLPNAARRRSVGMAVLDAVSGKPSLKQP